MRRIDRFVVIAALVGLSIAGLMTSGCAKSEAAVPTASPNSPTSGDLVNKPKAWDGRRITFQGEALTQAMYRGDYAWIHLNDDAYYLKNVEEGSTLGGYNSGHAVWIPAEQAREIGIFGDYTHEGDVVEVTGVFNAACGQHGGDMDIHADALDVVTPGRVVDEVVHPVKAGLAAGLTLLAALMWFVQRRARHLDAFGSLASRRRK